MTDTVELTTGSIPLNLKSNVLKHLYAEGKKI